jgi:hypothetical protein
MIRQCLTVGVAAAVLAACGDGTGPRVPTEVDVDPPTVSMETSDTVRVQAVVLDQDGRPYTTIPSGYEITWSTSAPLVAEVQDGLIRGLRPGQAIITASAGDLAGGQIQVTVAPRTVSTELSFSYDGFQTGTFDVDVAFRLDQMDWSGEYALSWVAQDPDEAGDLVTYQDFQAQHVRPDGKLDWIWFWTVGEVTETGAWNIDGGYFITGFDLFDESFEAVYAGSGTLDITTVADRRLAGTFAMGMVELDAQDNPTGETIDITSGAFAVPVVIASEVAASVAAEAMPGVLEMPERLRTLRETLGPRR